MQYEIIASDTNVRINTLNPSGIYEVKKSYPREGYSLELNNNKIELIEVSTRDVKLEIEKTSQVGIINDNRNGGVGLIEVPDRLTDLYEVLNNPSSPFFFNDLASSSLTSLNNINSSLVNISNGNNGINTEENLYGSQGTITQSILWELQEIKKVLKKIYS